MTDFYAPTPCRQCHGSGRISTLGAIRTLCPKCNGNGAYWVDVKGIAHTDIPIAPGKRNAWAREWREPRQYEPMTDFDTPVSDWEWVWWVIAGIAMGMLLWLTLGASQAEIDSLMRF